MKGVSLLLGNELAGEKVTADPVMLKKLSAQESIEHLKIIS